MPRTPEATGPTLLRGVPRSTACRFLIYRAPAALYMALIFYMSSGPVESKALASMPDYFLHSLGYSVLFLLYHWAIHERLAPASGRGGFWLPALLTVAYAVSDEYHQSFVPAREASYRDLLFDGSGAILGILYILGIDRLISLFRAPSSP